MDLPVPGPLLSVAALGSRLLGGEPHGGADGRHLRYGFTLDTRAAERDLEIQSALALAAAEQAKAEVAVQLALAEVYAEHPEYLQLQTVTANASALQPTDKVIFTPEGTVPTLVLPGPGIVPTVDTSANPATD